MDSKDFQFEELFVPEAVCLPFHGFDFVVGSFQGAGRDRVVVVGQDAVEVLGHRVRHVAQHPDPRGAGIIDPVDKVIFGRGLIGLFPDLA